MPVDILIFKIEIKMLAEMAAAHSVNSSNIYLFFPIRKQDMSYGNQLVGVRHMCATVNVDISYLWHICLRASNLMKCMPDDMIWHDLSLWPTALSS